MRHAPLVVGLVLLVSGVALAEIPQAMGYQGMITDDGGIPVDDDTYTMRFMIYDAESGGSLLWDSGDMSVSTGGGVFSVLLGESPQRALNLDFDQDYWLLVTFEGENQTPRKPLGSVGYAFYGERRGARH